METPIFEALQQGDSLPPLVTEPISRQTLALYAGASGDHNPMHIDSDFAKQSGMDDVFCARDAEHGVFGEGTHQLGTTNRSA